MQLRRARKDDLLAVAEVHRAAIAVVCAQDYPPPVIEAWLAKRDPERHLRHIEADTVWLAEEEDAVLGFGGVDLRTARIESLFVHPRANGRGIARRIVERLEDAVRDARLAELTLDSSLSAVSFYERIGFRRTGENSRLKLSDGITLDGVVMRKQLAAPASAAPARKAKGGSSNAGASQDHSC